MAENPEKLPFLRIVRGDASDEEIAALVAAVAALTAARNGAGGRQAQPPIRNNWNEKARLIRAAVHPSAGGWRRSALP